MATFGQAIAALVPPPARDLARRLGLGRGSEIRRRLGALQASNDRLKRAERLAGIGEYVWNVDTGALWWSENCYRLYGVDPDAGITIEHAFGAIHPDDAALASEVTATLLQGAHPTETPLRIVRPDGSVRHMLASGELYLENGQRHVFGVMKDITELADARSGLDEAHRQYRFLFEHNPVPMWICDRETLVVLAANDAMLRHYGFERRALIGRGMDTIFAPDAMQALLAVERDTGRACPQGGVWTQQRADGTRLRMALFTHDLVFEGHPARLVAAQDVTERERNEERFRLVARAASDAMFDLDLEHGRLWWSDSLYALFGHAPGATGVSRRAWLALVHPDDVERVIAGFERALASSGDEWRDEYRFRHAAGHYVQVAVRGLIERDAAGRARRMVGGMLDVTEAREREARLRLLQRAVESTDNGILIADANAPDLPVVYANPAFEAITGYTAAEITGRNCRILQREDRAQAGIAEIRHALADSGEVRTVLRNYRKDGALFWNEVYIAPVRDDHGVLTHFVGVLHDVTDRQDFEAHLAHRATHDELTGLPNRVLLEDRLQQAMRVADRSGLHAVVVFIDLDDFKIVNDSLGHGAGDALLREVSDRLAATVRETDTVSRLGGDEFVAVLNATSRDERPAEIVARLADALAQPVRLGEVAHRLTASIGYCCYPGDGDEPPALLRHADSAMYEAKRRGRNRAVAYRHEFDYLASRKQQLIGQLRDALDGEQFELAFQPQVDGDGRVRALEALVRWRHPTRGLVPPSEFIGACEDSGLIVELGRHVLRGAAHCQRRLADAGLDIRVSVNVSAAQFTDELYHDVAAALDGHVLIPGALDIELTESVLMDNPGHAVALMQRLAALGVSFSVDNFGTGYSSLGHLKRFPIRRLKIDRSFVQELDRDTGDAAVCLSIIGFAHGMELATVAEGVESERQRRWLCGHGCDEMQGFLFGRPEPFDALLPRLAGTP